MAERLKTKFLEEEKLVDGKVRKYYNITQHGDVILNEAKNKVFELFTEMEEIL